MQRLARRSPPTALLGRNTLSGCRGRPLLTQVHITHQREISRDFVEKTEFNNANAKIIYIIRRVSELLASVTDSNHNLCHGRQQVMSENHSKGSRSKRRKYIMHGKLAKDFPSEMGSWHAMRCRCLNEKDQAYDKYGGRGIIICDRWKDSFKNFLEDMGLKPTKKHTIDRIDGEGNYEPNNCCWATMKEQTKHRKPNHLLTLRGETKYLTEWAEILNIKADTLRARIGAGWTNEAVLTTPVMKPSEKHLNKKMWLYTHNGVTKPVSKWAKEFGIAYGLVHLRKKLGWTTEEALFTPIRRKK